MHLRVYICAHICIVSGRDNDTSYFSGIQRVEEETTVTNSRAVGRVCKINALEERRHGRMNAYLGRLDLTGDWVIMMTSDREQHLFSLLSPVCFSGEVANIPHLFVSQKKSQNPSGECRKERARTSILRWEASAATGEAVAACLLLPKPRRDLLPSRILSFLASANFTFI